MNIEERIKEVDLRPSDIVKLQVASSKPIGLSQATGWIKNPTATKAIEQLLWRLCDEKVESGLTFSKPGRKKESVVAEIFSEVKYAPVTKESFDGAKASVTSLDEIGQVFHSTDSVLNAIREKKAASQKIPAKKPPTPSITTVSGHDLPSAVHSGFSWDANMTMKRVGNIVKLNVNDLSYTIDFEKAKSGFLVDGKKYLLSDFTEVK